jgi:arylsulfate sulfotransferase
MTKIVLLLAVASSLFLVACGSGGNKLTSVPNPLVAQYTVNARAGSAVAVEFGPDTNYGFTTSATTVPEGEGKVTVLVAGMKADSTYHMRAITTLSDGTKIYDSDRTFATGKIPDNRRPKATVTLTSGMTPAPGIELLALRAAVDNSLAFPIEALDPAGNLIWYYDYDASIGSAQPIKLRSNGHFLVVFFGAPTSPEPGGTVREIDLAGTTLKEFTVADLNKSLTAAGYTWNAFSIHHDLVELANGHLLLLVNTLKDYTDLAGFSGVTKVQGDAIIDLDENLKPVWVWSTFDHLDVNRHPYGFKQTQSPPGADWTHSNALVYSPDDGNLVLSIRHQSWVIKIDYANGQGSGNILWRLGYQGDFKLLSAQPEPDWFYAQHFPNITSPNSSGVFQLAVFDNGDDRVLDSNGTICGLNGAPACYSRAVIYEVNETDMTARVLWSDTLPYSFWGGAIQQLPNNNMFVGSTTPLDLENNGARIMEVTQDQNPQVVWKLEVAGQNSYRTIHLPSLYPGVQW